jgi:hypothetical protein
MAEAISRVPDKSSSSPDDPNSKQQQLQLLHHRLMIVYVYAIETVSESNRLPTGPRRRAALRPSATAARQRGHLLQRFRLSNKRRPVTRAFVESHIKAKLNELQAVYAQMEQSVTDTDATHSFLCWLRDTQDSLTRFSATLTVMASVRRMAGALWPLVIALAVVGTVWHAIFNLIGGLRTLLFGVLIVAIYSLTGLGLAAGRKRSFFLAPISVSPWTSNSGEPSTESVTAKNVYAAEDDLFGCIDRAKRLEPPLDMYIYVAALLGWAVFAFAVGIQNHDPTSSWGGAFFLLFVIMGIFVMFTRKIR